MCIAYLISRIMDSRKEKSAAAATANGGPPNYNMGTPQNQAPNVGAGGGGYQNQAPGSGMQYQNQNHGRG